MIDSGACYEDVERLLNVGLVCCSQQLWILCAERGDREKQGYCWSSMLLSLIIVIEQKIAL
jgi:hypothetical protein